MISECIPDTRHLNSSLLVCSQLFRYHIFCCAITHWLSKKRSNCSEKHWLLFSSSPSLRLSSYHSLSFPLLNTPCLLLRQFLLLPFFYDSTGARTNDIRARCQSIPTLNNEPIVHWFLCKANRPLGQQTSSSLYPLLSFSIVLSIQQNPRGSTWLPYLFRLFSLTSHRVKDAWKITKRGRKEKQKKKDQKGDWMHWMRFSILFFLFYPPSLCDHYHNGERARKINSFDIFFLLRCPCVISLSSRLWCHLVTSLVYCLSVRLETHIHHPNMRLKQRACTLPLHPLLRLPLLLRLPASLPFQFIF